MYLRKLAPQDAPLMLEWMHDPGVVAHLSANFAEKSVEDCRRFIASSLTDENDLHLAIADENDEYMGTVSLKHVDRSRGTAEFAITVRATAMGRGFSRYGMEEILKMGIGELDLTAIYWCVSPKNRRAVRFYDKCGYCRTQEVPPHILAPYPEDMELNWYVFTGGQNVRTESEI